MKLFNFQLPTFNFPSFIILFVCLFSTTLSAQQAPSPTKPAAKQNPSNMEVYPTFPGGEAALWKYVADNMVYPKDAMEANVQGIVLVKFIVDYDGSISNIEIKLSISESLDAEAIRIIKNMPKWTNNWTCGGRVSKK